MTGPAVDVVTGVEASRRNLWPAYEKHNQAAVTHGVFRSGRAELIDDEVNMIAEQTAVTFPWTAPYGEERFAYARAIVDERAVRAYLDDVGMLDENHVERPAVRTLARFATIAASRRKDLGLNPMAHARLLALVSEVVRVHPDRAGALDDGLQALLAQGRAALEAGATRKDAS